MDIEVLKKLLRSRLEKHNAFVKAVNEAWEYYGCDNAINTYHYPGEDAGNPLRRADNRISHGFYPVLVNQEAAYLFTYPPTFDTGEKGLNDKIKSTLGEQWNKVCQSLSVDASNSTTAWLHVWKDAAGRFRYWPVDARQIIPIYARTLDRELLAVLRRYEDMDDSGGGGPYANTGQPTPAMPTGRRPRRRKNLNPTTAFPFWTWTRVPKRSPMFSGTAGARSLSSSSPTTTSTKTISNRLRGSSTFMTR